MSEDGARADRQGEFDTTADTPTRNPLTWLLVGLVRAYQLVVSPWLPPSCKYYPSCSAYAVTALRRHGVVKGSLLAGWRLLRCNPWSLGGVDHVPPRGQWHGSGQRAGPSADGVVGDGKARTLSADTWGARTSAPKDR
ncbi:membrane protein insertion efficiency factor YidD [Georgenia yuyongxinii]|uniref:Putative membrane protein insertion efficiency factor n=1 Tax=Georgenia yuyongxinii TaxID=2589797 RepID=A0A552WQ14_9MICO|nr:membrane protein insertion efficiency factor YidD [Georgenia yuyongxinii]TRW44845.1 membrane protein insertion efficiency factor YidD [Georgenia yuyongxinii]